MKLPIYQVDAFTTKVFSGNPAAVCFLDAWLDDSILQGIAAENNLSETAFLVAAERGFELRWFTPLTEVALCGHATLASAYVLFNCRGWSAETITFQTRQSGLLTVRKDHDLLELDFPARPPVQCESPAGLIMALNATPLEVLSSAEDLLVVLCSEQEVKAIKPDFNALLQTACRGVIVTAKGDEVDFASRFFAPRVGIPEDPVTGSAHCVLIPYWARQLGKSRLRALQVSRRGGELFCQEQGNRVIIAGRAALYMEGSITI